MAASKGQMEVVKYLISKGADKDYVHPASQNTAFHMAAFIGDEKLMRFTDPLFQRRTQRKNGCVTHRAWH